MPLIAWISGIRHDDRDEFPSLPTRLSQVLRTFARYATRRAADEMSRNVEALRYLFEPIPVRVRRRNIQPPCGSDDA